jgi:hypothetical protein
VEKSSSDDSPIYTVTYAVVRRYSSSLSAMRSEGHCRLSLRLTCNGLLNSVTWLEQRKYRHSLTWNVVFGFYKNAFLRDVTSCGSCNNRRFGRTYRLNHQGENNQRVRNNVSSNLQLMHCATVPWKPYIFPVVSFSNACLLQSVRAKSLAEPTDRPPIAPHWWLSRKRNTNYPTTEYSSFVRCEETSHEF